MAQIINATRHMYQDGNDLVIVYPNVFNKDYSLEDFLKDEIKNDYSSLIEPHNTATPPMPAIKN